jgi:gliding motility-associated-like protein
VPDTIPANGIQNINLGSAQQGHLYTGYLDINGCQISMPSVYLFAPIQDSVTITKACQDPTGSISIVIQPDSIALSRLGAYTVHVSVSGIDTNFTVEQNIGFNSNTPQTVVINNLPPSRYRLNCYYDNTCDTTNQIYDLRTVQFHFQSPLLLCGQPDTVYAIMDGGLAPYTYQWSVPAGNVPWLLAPAAGNYTLTITDALGCSFSNAINVLASAPVVIDTVLENRQPCTNNLFSNSQVIYHGGSAPVSIVWSSGETGTIASYIPQGNSNWVRVYDAVGCADTVEFANTKQLPVQQTNTHTDITCYSADDGSIQLTATNGYPPYTYWWSGQQGNSSLSSLSPGSYYYEIIDSRGCSTGGVITLSEPNNIQLAITTSDAACTSATGEIFVSAWGGTGQLTIDWGNGVTGSSISNLSAGTYTFMVTDENNCNRQGSAVVGTASPITATYTQADVSCYNGNNGNATITIANAELPVTYTWSNLPNNTPSITGLQAGVYTVNVADAVGCTYQHTFYITQPTQLIALVDTGAGITCNNGTTFVSVYGVGGTPPYSGTSNSNLYAGPYHSTITDSKGCSATVNFNISEPPPITVNATILENPGCINNGVIHLDVTGGIGPYILQDINGSTTFTDSTTAYGIYAGNYTATITDSLGCSKPVNVAINSTSTLHVTSTLVQPTCTDSWGHINITATGGIKPYTIILSGSQYTFTDSVSIPVSQGFYTIDVTDSVMCHYSVSGNIVPWVNFYYGTQTKPVSCNGGNDGELTITVYGGQKPYMYNGATVDSTFTIPDLAAGLYTDSITDAYGCQLIFNYSISEPTALLIDSVNQIDSITCYGRNNASIQVFAHGGTPFYTYQLTGNGVNIIQQQSIFTSLPPGTFTITVTDSFGCQKLLNVTINQFTHAHHRVDIDTVSCYGKNDGAIKLYSEPAYRNTYTYSLNNGEPQVHNVFYSLTADTYQIVVSDNTGCTDTLQVTVPQPEQIDARVWLNEVLLPVDSFVLLERLFADFTKHNLNPWTVDFSPDIPRIEQSDTLVKVLPRESLTYTVTVYMDSIDKTCFVQYTGFIDLLNVPPLPNIVTPNGDGYNDTWEIDLDKFPGAEVTIFDRWGEIIYESKEYRNDWDLRYHGKLLADGTYFYILKAPAQGNRIYKGDINVLNASK